MTLKGTYKFCQPFRLYLKINKKGAEKKETGLWSGLSYSFQNGRSLISSFSGGTSSRVERGILS
jgi:hypothetical protein